MGEERVLIGLSLVSIAGSQLRAIVPPRGQVAMCGDMSGCHNRGVLLASSGERPGRLNTLQRIGHPL